MSESNDTELVDKALQLLTEHFDCVQIFASRHEPGTDDGTLHCAKGTGHWFGRYGHVREWLTRQDERTKQDVRSNG